MVFYMMIGLPASGKSTKTMELLKEDATIQVHSSDAIREELYGGRLESKNDAKVSRLLKQRILTDLQENKSVLCDAANLTVKKRAEIMDLIKEIPCQKIAIYMDTPKEDCLERNKQRSEEQQVPAVAIHTAAKRFEMPTLAEGFSEIIIFEPPMAEATSMREPLNQRRKDIVPLQVTEEGYPTGYVDSKNKEICVGDIVTEGCNGLTAKVVWNKERNSFWLEGLGEGYDIENANVEWTIINK